MLQTSRAWLSRSRTTTAREARRILHGGNGVSALPSRTIHTQKCRSVIASDSLISRRSKLSPIYAFSNPYLNISTYSLASTHAWINYGLASRTYSAAAQAVVDEKIKEKKESVDEVLEAGLPPSKVVNSEERLAKRKKFLKNLKERYSTMNKERAEEAKRERLQNTNGRLSRMWKSLVHGFHHTVDGFKLLATNVRITAGILKKLNTGEDLLRREQRMLMMTTVDLIRMVPFSLFIIIPGGELLLPVALKLFPQMLPSTFDEKFPEDEYFSEVPDQLRHKRMLALHLCEEANLAHCPIGEVKEALMRVRLGSSLTVNDIRLVAPLVKGRITLPKLVSEPNLIHSLSVLLDCKTTGSPDAMATRIQKKMAVLKYDDKMLYVEGIDDLSRVELVVANRRRTLRHSLISTEALQQQLKWWVELSIDPKVPNLLLLFMAPNAKPSIEKSRVMYADTAIYNALDKLFQNDDAEKKLDSLSSTVPKSFLTQVQMLLDHSDRDLMAAREHDKASLKEKLETIRDEEKLMNEERAEKKKAEEKEKDIELKEELDNISETVDTESVQAKKGDEKDIFSSSGSGNSEVDEDKFAHNATKASGVRHSKSSSGSSTSSAPPKME
ncbi:hypothetical protein SARC_04521 [Sphaeroforma arctica JP610]|uniref:Letm1 RBD domain-containing protein n=1 Tax=Sphaeroforma arctica JP610 TaxID=667725 RepID=A0A0L0G261_9EUKA|nr:hypothetical protein SARC_04521 [Sphaeroforma arctica JP610]KNC83222.1 hypothetical protein SARC_04521 [Sphaeroforma arctica JP610]|eukprot:XP_014157124.1 hypothetical protein SARC_04521 [Sphaeroforma arctica JP610]